MSDNKSYKDKYFFMDDYIDANAKAKKTIPFQSFLEMDYSKFAEIHNEFGKEWQQNAKDGNGLSYSIVLDYMEFYADVKYNSILIYGYGSKRQIIEEFLNTRLLSVPKLVVDGFNPATSSKVLLNKLTSFVKDQLSTKMDVEKPTEKKKGIKVSRDGRHFEQLDFLKAHLSAESEFPFDQVILAINNIDGVSFRDELSMGILAELAALDKITLVATIDNVKFPTLLTPQMKENFRFAYLLVNTMMPYIIETKYMMESEKSDNKCSEDALVYALKSLTDTQKGVIEILAKHYLDNPTTAGLDFKELYRLVFDSTIVSNQNQLKESLVEIVDQKIFKETKKDSKMFYQLDYPKMTLQRIVAKEFK